MASGLQVAHLSRELTIGSRIFLWSHTHTKLMRTTWTKRINDLRFSITITAWFPFRADIRSHIR